LGTLLLVISAVSIALGLMRTFWIWFGGAIAMALTVAGGWLVISLLVMGPVLVRLVLLKLRHRQQETELLEWSETMRQSRRQEYGYQSQNSDSAAWTPPAPRDEKPLPLDP
jgi:hypothetical protein